MADKLVAKVLKKDEKRKEDSKKETKEKEKKKKPAKASFRPQPMYNPYAWQNPQAMGMGFQQPGMAQGYPQAMGGYGYNPRPDYRSCLNCKQMGHIARVCPYRAAPSAALGAAPK